MSPARRVAWLAAAAIVLVWGAAVAGGLGPALLGADATSAQEALLLLPGLAAAGAVLLALARRDLAPVARRWRPGVVVEGFERRADRAVAEAPEPPPEPHVDLDFPEPTDPAPAPRPAEVEAPRRAPVASTLVALGPHADPAWASWLLRWSAPGLGEGVIVLPNGDHVLLGRDPEADLVAQVDQISWHHLELSVRRGEVRVMELGSSNGTRLVGDGGGEPEALDPRAPVVLAAWERLELAEPTALTLTLEPLT